MPLFSPRPRKRNNKKDKHMIAESEGVEGIGNCSFPGSPSGTKSTSFLTLAVQASFIYMYSMGSQGRDLASLLALSWHMPLHISSNVRISSFSVFVRVRDAVHRYPTRWIKSDTCGSMDPQTCLRSKSRAK